MFQKTIAILLIVSMTFFSTFLYAETPRIIHLEKGQSAPFSGALLNDEAKAIMIAEKEALKDECKLKTDYLSMRKDEECSLKVKLKDLDLSLTEKKYSSILDIKNEELKKTRELVMKNGDSNKMWWATGGALVGIAVTIGMFFLVAKVAESER